MPGDVKDLWFFDTRRTFAMTPDGGIVEASERTLTYSDVHLENPREVGLASLSAMEYASAVRIGSDGALAVYTENLGPPTTTLPHHIHALDANANERWV